MRQFLRARKGLLALVGMALAVAAVLHAQPPGGPGMGPGAGGFMNRMAMGTVESVNGNQIVVKGLDGQTRTVVAGTNATIIRFSRGTKADIKKDAVVQVTGQYDQNQAWFIPRVIRIGEGIQRRGGPGPGFPLMGTGKVYDVKDNQVHLTLSLALNADTQIIRGDKIQANQIQAGENLFAMGEPGDNNTLTAQNITVGELQAAMGGMMGGPGGFGGRRGGAGGRPGGRGQGRAQ